MHYALIAIGSRGDTQPFIALSLGLIRRGHRVTLLAHENFQSLKDSYNIAFHPLAGNPEQMLQSPEARRLLQSGNTPRLLRYLHRCYQKIQHQLNQDLLDGCQPADALVTSAIGVPWVSCIAEKTGKRWTIIQLNFPTDTTSAFPFAGLDYGNFPAYNRLTYRLIRSAFWRPIKRAVNDFRRSLGLPLLRKSIFDKATSDRILTLYAVSPALLPRPGDWHMNRQLTGFLQVPPNPETARVPEGERPRHWLVGRNPATYPPRHCPRP
jgi:sterol 3beta-glucosyltransferase